MHHLQCEDYISSQTIEYQAGPLLGHPLARTSADQGAKLIEVSLVLDHLQERFLVLSVMAD